MAKNVGGSLTSPSAVEVGTIVTVCLVGLILAHTFGLVSFRRIGRIVKLGKNRD